jgi:hypothetical protein
MLVARLRMCLRRTRAREATSAAQGDDHLEEGGNDDAGAFGSLRSWPRQ